MIPYLVEEALIDADSIIYKVCGTVERYKWIFIKDDGTTFELLQNNKKLLEKEINKRGLKGYIDKVNYIVDNLAEEIRLNIGSILKYYKEVLNDVINEIWYFTEIDGSNFRYEVAKTLPYKGNRPSRPISYWDVRLYLESKLNNYVVIKGSEADDALADQYEPDLSLLCHIDKDLDQLYGYHWNPNKNEFYYVSKEQAIRNLWRQVVCGDKGTDNIPGMKYWLLKNKMGFKNFEKKFNKCITEEDFRARLLNVYKELLNEEFNENLFYERLNEQYRLVKLGNIEENYKWQELKNQ